MFDIDIWTCDDMITSAALYHMATSAATRQQNNDASRGEQLQWTKDETFYLRDAMLARVIGSQRVCLSICLSVRHAPVLCQNEES